MSPTRSASVTAIVPREQSNSRRRARIFEVATYASKEGKLVASGDTKCRRPAALTQVTAKDLEHQDDHASGCEYENRSATPVSRLLADLPEAAENILARRMTMESSMSIAIIAAAAIAEFFTAFVITLFVRASPVKSIRPHGRGRHEAGTF